MEEVYSAIAQAVIIILVALVGYVARAFVAWLNKKGIVEQIMAKEELALIAVQFVEQTYWRLSGPEKLNAAVEWLSKQLKAKNINVTPNEIHALIESAVYEMNSAWIELEE
jgi:LL-H family phage holin